MKPISKTEINSKILPRIVSNFLKKAVVWVSFTQPEELLRVISWKNIQGVPEQTFKNWNLFQRNHFSTLDSTIFPKSKELQCILINNRNAQVTSQLYWRMKKNCFRAWSVTKTHIICKKFHGSFCIIWQLKGETLTVNVLGMILSMIHSMTLSRLKRVFSLSAHWWESLGKVFFFFWRVFFFWKNFFPTWLPV